MSLTSLFVDFDAYFASAELMFPVGARDERLPAKAWVFGLRLRWDL